MRQASYKSRGLSNGINPLSSEKKEETSWNTYIFWGVCGAVMLVLVIYLSFSPSNYRSQPIVVGQERIAQLEESKRKIPIIEREVDVLDGKIFIRECKPQNEYTSLHKVDLLFLHGKKYSSSTWKGLGTLQIFAYYGYRTIAVDLPGYGLSKKYDPPQNENGYVRFMEQLIASLELKKVVIITPSMSGMYAIPYLIHYNDNNLAGMICVSPQSTKNYNKQDYLKISIPVLVMWGERDRTELAAESRFYLEDIPNSELMMVPSAEHAAFVGNPKEFHTFILSFLSTKCKLGANEYSDDDDSNYYTDYDNDVFKYEDEDNYDDNIGDMFDGVNDYNYDYGNDFGNDDDNNDIDNDDNIDNDNDNDIDDDNNDYAYNDDEDNVVDISQSDQFAFAWDAFALGNNDNNDDDDDADGGDNDDNGSDDDDNDDDDDDDDSDSDEEYDD